MANRADTVTHDTTDKLMRDLKTGVQEAEGILKSTASDLSDTGKEVRARLHSALESAKTTYHDLQERAAEGARKTDVLIRDNPYQSMGIAFGVGLLVGVLVTRK